MSEMNLCLYLHTVLAALCFTSPTFISVGASWNKRTIRKPNKYLLCARGYKKWIQDAGLVGERDTKKVEVQKYINVKEVEERLNMWSLSEDYYYGSKNTSQK